MGFHAARWLGARLLGVAGFHQLGSDFADGRIARVRERLACGDTVYLAGLGPPGTHNSGVALVEVSQANGPRLIVNNEEERFSGNKHTTEYPQGSIDATGYSVVCLLPEKRSSSLLSIRRGPFAWVTSTSATPELCVPGGPIPAR